MKNNNAIILDKKQVIPYLDQEFIEKASDSPTVLDGLKRLNKLPFAHCNCYYSDDIWDFSNYATPGISPSFCRFHFKKIDIHYREMAKDYCLCKLLENKEKVQVIVSKIVKTLKHYFNYLSANHVYDITEAPYYLINKCLEDECSQFNPSKLWEFKSTLRDFYLCYSANVKEIMTSELETLFTSGDYKLLSAYREQHKTQHIPSDFYNKWVSSCIKVIDNNGLPIYLRAAACIEIIISQTGLRMGEVLSLTINSVRTIKIFNGEEANYLEYKTWKREKGNKTVSTVKTYVNELTKKAVVTLEELYDKERKSSNTNYLFLGDTSKNLKLQLPFVPISFVKYLQLLCIYLDDQGFIELINTPSTTYPMLSKAKPTQGVPKKKSDETPIKTIMTPTSQQLRFYVCTDLHNKGVPLKYVQKFMSHLSPQMAAYHVNETTTHQENMDYSIKVLREIVSGDSKLLGDSKGLSDRIQDFIKENNFHVEKDIDTISSLLAKKIPIRQKTGGVCIKSSLLRDCSIDAKTNEFYCAYGVCANIFHFYYMINITYRQCKELEESININTANGHMRHVQKESNMLKTITTKRLEPELNELKDMIEKHGIEYIYQKHPDIKELIENMDIVEEKVKTWKSIN